jgi:hypothetical protein
LRLWRLGQRQRQHEPAAHLGRVDQPPDRRVDDHDPNDEQRDPVDVGGQDLQAAEAECPAPSGGPAGERGRPQRKRERSGIGEHVPRVGEQRERPGEDPEDDLARHQAEDQRKSERQGTSRGRVLVRVTHRFILAAAIRSGGVGCVKSNV